MPGSAHPHDPHRARRARARGAARRAGAGRGRWCATSWSRSCELKVPLTVDIGFGPNWARARSSCRSCPCPRAIGSIRSRGFWVRRTSGTRSRRAPSKRSSSSSRRSGSKRGMRVLDVGCGPGRHSLALARRGFDVIGVDRLREFVALARDAAAEESLPRPVRTWRDVRDLAYDGEFDAAICLCQGGFGLLGGRDDARRVRPNRAIGAAGWRTGDLGVLRLLRGPFPRGVRVVRCSRPGCCTSGRRCETTPARSRSSTFGRPASPRGSSSCSLEPTVLDVSSDSRRDPGSIPGARAGSRRNRVAAPRSPLVMPRFPSTRIGPVPWASALTRGSPIAMLATGPCH